ncbi:PRA1 family protein-domain-containing protein [Entophlyctis helioformis]|nr:PRA1 family protein-domain-containing protein [Entophlyctis helioformis]
MLSSSPASVTAAAAAASAAPGALAASANKLGSYIRIDAQTWDNVKQESQRRLEALRPWSEFFDRLRFAVPKNFSEFNQRLTFNVRHFQNNYILIVLIVIAYFLITEPFLLVSVGFLIVGFKWISSLPTNEPTTIAGNKFSQLQLWMAYGVISFFLLFFTGVSTTLFWVASLCAAVVAAHAGSMDKPVEAEFGDEQV